MTTSRTSEEPPPGTAQGEASPSAFAPLRVPAYRRMWSAATISHVGTFLQLVAAPWLMNELTGSPFMVSLVTAALTFPRLALTVPAGVLADAFDRRTLLLVGQLASSVAVAVMAVLTAIGGITPESLIALSLALGTGTALTMPAYQTLVPDLVPRSILPAAVTLNSAAFNVARAVGPSIGGLFVAAGLTAAAFGVNAASYLAVVGVLLTFPRETLDEGPREPWMRSAAAGMRYARFTRPVRIVLLVAAAFALTAASVQTLLPNVASDDLGLGAGGFGLLFGAFGAGALVGAVTRERARRLLAGSSMLPASITGFGLAGAVFGLSRLPLLSGAALAVAGLCWVWTLTTINASVQLLAPRWVRGRLMSLYITAIGLQPFGALVAGALAEQLGSGNTVALLTAGTAGLGLVAARLRLPVLGEIVEPAPPPEDFSVPAHPVRVAGSPVIVATTWRIDPERAEEFFAVMRDLRRHRFRTGARRWSLFRDAGEPYRVTEMFELADWDDHLRQHRRIDADAAAVLRRATALDCSEDGPHTRHLTGVDVVDPGAPPIAEQLLTVHEEYHRADGSVPLDVRRPAR